MAMFGNAGKAIINQLGINFLGRDFQGEARRRAEIEAIRKAQQEAAGLLQPVPGAMREAPIANAEGMDISAAFSPVLEQGPSRRRGPAEVAAELARLTASTPGFNPTPWKDLAAFAKPDIQIGPDGVPYDKGDPNSVPTRFRNPTNVNGWITDLNNPANEGQYLPTLPNGMIPDGKGGVVNASGLAPAMQEQTRAETLGRTEGTMFRVPRPEGGDAMMTGGQYLGGGAGGGLQKEGFGLSQTPADAAYNADLAKAEQGRYQGILSAGENARSMESNLRRMEQLLGGMSTGRLTPAGKELASFATSFGVKVDPKWGNVEAANAIANKLALDYMGGSLGAGFSNADRDFVKSLTPQVAQTPQGRAQLIKFGIAKARRDQDVARMARQWQSRAGRLDRPDRSGRTFYDYLEAWGEANPLVGRQ